jgi:TonB family protein
MLNLLGEAMLRSTALFAVVWLLLKVIRLRDLRTEKLVWTVVVVVSLAMPILMQSFSLLLPARSVPIQVVGRIEVLIAAQSHKFGIGQAVWTVYLLVTGVLLARFATGLWMAARLRRTAHRIAISCAGSVDVRSSPQVRTPSSFGPTILLPAEWESWDMGKLKAVIAHERAHIREHDCYRLWLTSLYSAFFWFNPCAIWLRRRLSVLAELISDEAAIAVTGNRIGYAEVLVNFAAEAQIPTVTVGMALRSTLTPRLKRLLESDMPTGTLRRSRKLMLLSAIILTAATAACAATAPLELPFDQDSAVSWVSGQPMGNFYPKALQKKGVEGMVVCRVTIDATGRVTKVVAVRAEQHPELAAAAVKAVKTFRFNNSLSRPVIKTMAVKFELRSETHSASAG